MGIVVDIVILVILALSIFLGYRRGLIKCAVDVLSFFIAIVVVIILTNPISNLIINNTKIDDNIKTTILEKVSWKDANSDELKLDENNSVAPQVVKDYVNDTIKNAEGNVADTLAQNLAVIIINVVVAIALFFITKFALMFVKVLAELVGKIPLIKQFNKAGGFIYGIGSGIVKIYIILAVISIIVPLLTDTSLADAINKSTIGSGMYNNNLVLKFIL